MKHPETWWGRGCAGLVLFLAIVSAGAQTVPTASTYAQSASGQFTVTAPQQTYFPSPYSGTNTTIIRLEPAMVAMSAERIRQSVWRELGVTDQWQHKVFISLHVVTPRTGDRISISVDRAPSGWSYRVTLPDQISKERYLRAMTQLILLELANRSATVRSAEIPSWLSDGLAFHLLANNSDELVLTPPRQNIGGVFLSSISPEKQQVSSLERAHKTLLGEMPLTFEELSWPTGAQLEGSDTARFLACSQLFTRRLLELNEGRKCMREFVAALPGYLNWQIAFLAAFKQHFSRPLEIEKWWSLQAAAFSGRDLIQTWTYEESWTKLSAALREPVAVHSTPDELPVRSEVSLQTIIGNWNATRQREALQNRMRDLDILRSRVAPELTGLATEYRQSLDQSLRQQNLAGQSWSKRGAPGGFGGRNPLTTVKRLDVLDAQLEKLRPGSLTIHAPQPAPPPATAFGSPLSNATP